MRSMPDSSKATITWMTGAHQGYSTENLSLQTKYKLICHSVNDFTPISSKSPITIGARLQGPDKPSVLKNHLHSYNWSSSVRWNNCKWPIYFFNLSSTLIILHWFANRRLSYHHINFIYFDVPLLKMWKRTVSFRNN